MHNISVMQLRDTLKASLEDLLSIRLRHLLLLNQAQEVVREIFVHKDAFAGDGT